MSAGAQAAPAQLLISQALAATVTGGDRATAEHSAAPGTTPDPQVQLTGEDVQAGVEEKTGEGSNGDVCVLGRRRVFDFPLFTCTLRHQHSRRCSWDSPAVLCGALLIPL